MSNGFLQASNFDQSTNQQQGMSNMFSVFPANHLTVDQDRIRSELAAEQMRLRQAAAAAMQARQPCGLARPSNHNSPAITTHQNPNPSARRRPSNFSNGMLGVRHDSRIQKPQPQRNIYNNNNQQHHSNSRGNLMALYRSQLDQFSQIQAAQAVQKQRELRAFQLLLSSMPPPSPTYNPMLLSSQPATALTMGLSQTLFQQQQQQQKAGNVKFRGFNFDSVHQRRRPNNPTSTLPNNPTSSLTIHEINMDDEGDQQDGLDLSLRL